MQKGIPLKSTTGNVTAVVFNEEKPTVALIGGGIKTHDTATLDEFNSHPRPSIITITAQVKDEFNTPSNTATHGCTITYSTRPSKQQPVTGQSILRRINQPCPVMSIKTQDLEQPWKKEFSTLGEFHIICTTEASKFTV
ncbi:hypothetical protein SADUNF_Sadunf10G0162800 [Salix dunnii]|uniref:Uncharacterized protein n=1 Tax=Salix dunnii TaxID=1413687 RepID=A0A835MZ10_9ROSI|nr:hypothetical protein SADUNF_Sadunf10G0162800 [Salix dunnii]